MKILLIQPPVRYISGARKISVSIPLGLLYIAAVLEENSFNVEVYDAQINIHVPSFNNTDDSVHIGDSWEIVASEIEKRSPDLVGITGSFTTQRDSVIRTAEIVKKINRDTVTVVGGNHASVKPDDFFNMTGAVDMVCMGEGEYTMLDIVRRLRDGGALETIPGTAVRSIDGIKVNPRRPYIKDIDELPFPAYHLVSIEDYFLVNKRGFRGRLCWPYKGSERAVSVITSRGCPYDCIFCSIHLHMGRKWRYHSVGYVLEHLEFLVSKYGVKHIHFEDDNLTLDRNRFCGILDGLLRKNMGITWDVTNGIRIDTMTRDILDDCKKSGCTYITFAVESGNQNVLDKIIKKRMNLDTVIKISRWFKEVSLDAVAYYVIGFPGETRQEMCDTIDFALDLQKTYDIAPILFIATPLPGTELEKIFRERGILKEELSPGFLSKMTQGNVLMGGDTFTADDLADMRRNFYRGYKVNFIYNCLVFFIRKPRAFIRFILKLIREKEFRKDKETFLSVLNFKRNF
jgi:radical SAM superfamily enzyme YgiQ (UPF0313 family)